MNASPHVPTPDRHVIVFDCNVYLDVARVIGEPFTWDSFNATLAGIARTTDPQLDSLRAVAMCTSGKFAGDATLEVWTNAHIDGVVLAKAVQSTTPDPETGGCGLGWSNEGAQGLVDCLIRDLTAMSSGGTLGSSHMPDGNPPLDHEDGMVYGACRALSGEDPLAHVYCVTRDRGFLDDYRAGKLSRHTRVVTPSQIVQAMRAARASHSMRRMRPRG